MTAPPNHHNSSPKPAVRPITKPSSSARKNTQQLPNSWLCVHRASAKPPRAQPTPGVDEHDEHCGWLCGGDGGAVGVISIWLSKAPLWCEVELCVWHVRARHARDTGNQPATPGAVAIQNRPLKIDADRSQQGLFFPSRPYESNGALRLKPSAREVYGDKARF